MENPLKNPDFNNKSIISSHLHYREIFSFLAVGALATTFNYLVFLTFLELFKLWYIASSCIGYFSGIFVSYHLNYRFTFKYNKEFTTNNLLVYTFIFLISLVLSSLLLYALTEHININPKISNIFAIAQSAITNYLGCKFIVFRKQGI